MDVGGFVFSDQLLQISALLPSHYVYGLGEHNGPLLKSTDWKQYTMWNTDAAPNDEVCRGFNMMFTPDQNLCKNTSSNRRLCTQATPFT